MYRGFNLQIGNKNIFDSFYVSGNTMYEQNKNNICSLLEDYCLPDGEVIAQDLMKEWFPKIKSDVFISHSHQDEKLAIGLAGWLKKHMNLDVFIDSCCWGNAYKLLKEIDNKICKSDDNSGTYDYQKRNQSTAHVHMMLMTSLIKMLDQSECIIFLNTPSSIQMGKYQGDKVTTTSPWIFAEIATTKTLEKKSPGQHRETGMIKKSVANNLSERYMFHYELNELSNFTELTFKDLEMWEIKKNGHLKMKHSLDVLYDFKP